MALQNFVDRSLPAISAEWLNQVDVMKESVVNVKDPRYGAVGDGATDDTAAIQAAIDFVSGTNGGTVYFPAGNYKTSATITVASAGTRIVGSGRNSTSILANFRGGAVIEVTASRCEIADLAVSSLSGSARRSASPLGVTPPSTAVDGNSLDYGLLFRQAPALTFTSVHRVEIVNQPADGLVFYGAGSCSRFEQVNINNCGGHGMYFDNGTRGGYSYDRPGIVDIVDCLIQLCWGHGIALGTEMSNSCYRFNLVNNEVFTNCLGDGGADQPTFYASLKGEIALRVENAVIELGATGFSNVGILLAVCRFVQIRTPRLIDCANYGVYIGPSCDSITVSDPYFSSSPTVAGFRVGATCENVRFDGLETGSITTLISSDSECRAIVNNKLHYTVPGSSTLWAAESNVSSTVVGGLLAVTSGIVSIVGEGDAADSISRIRFALGIEVPDYYRFTLCNFNAYNITLQDMAALGGTANLQLQGANAVLEPGESLSFIVKNGVYYAIGREIP